MFYLKRFPAASLPIFPNEHQIKRNGVGSPIVLDSEQPVGFLRFVFTIKP